VKELDHESRKALERSGNTDGGIDLDQYALGRLDVDLKLPGFVDGRIKECEKALVIGIGKGTSQSQDNLSYKHIRTFLLSNKKGDSGSA